MFLFCSWFSKWFLKDLASVFPVYLNVDFGLWCSDPLVRPRPAFTFPFCPQGGCVRRCLHYSLHYSAGGTTPSCVNRATKTVKGKKTQQERQMWPVPSSDSVIDFSSATLSHKRQWGREFRRSKVGQWAAQYKHSLHVAEQDTGPVKSEHHSGLWTTTGCCQSPKAAAGKSVVVTEWQFKFLNGKGGGIELISLWNMWKKKSSMQDTLRKRVHSWYTIEKVSIVV